QDNDYATWTSFKNRYWPRKYLIDKDGFIRYDHIGEGAYDETEKKIQELLAEIGSDVSDMGISQLEDKTPKIALTPELYTGYEFALPRGQNIGNEKGLQPDQTIDYKLPEKIKDNKIYLEGKWKSNSDNLQAQGKSSIILKFTASSVNIVADSLSDPIELEVFIDNKYVTKDQAGNNVVIKNGKSFVLIDEPKLYNLIDGNYGAYTLKLTTNSKDFNFNAFTFG
ncbi:MAG: thiol-disulfide isomerase, partial [Nanoarchaeota archaeon]